MYASGTFSGVFRPGLPLPRAYNQPAGAPEPCQVPAPRPLAVGKRGYLESRWRKPKPSERVRVAVKVSNSIGVGYGAEAVAAGVW
jgi:hypothetical protein